MRKGKDIGVGGYLGIDCQIYTYTASNGLLFLQPVCVSFPVHFITVQDQSGFIMLLLSLLSNISACHGLSCMTKFSYRSCLSGTADQNRSVVFVFCSAIQLFLFLWSLWVFIKHVGNTTSGNLLEGILYRIGEDGTG